MSDLFTYGSLMCNDIMHQVAGCRIDYVSATLKDFKRSKIVDEEYPGIVAHPGAEVKGVLYLHLPSTAIARLDIFEGEQYSRQEVQIITAQLAPHMPMSYVIKPEYSHLLTDETWDYRHFLAIGKTKFQKAYLGFQKI
ncbi:MAG: gamma-glutamylcyclotransferase [Proteobacteria bacterium]|nr:gamma-glutamylcyclotransferase [Pseudomonadota bacterium]